ncbi:hypothetical protein CHS0354_006993 [Potamilus streckersoni]|uniref:Uncharacterized protein n=1 Tax=Potamilus streckersoni TaxID=2493646 RepID=A0AAE0VKI4_9BIVA|nr:hypothetical protein CHS0354_006993 [Potamilus streckersoni]
MDTFVRRFQPEKYGLWKAGKDIAPHPEDDQGKSCNGHSDLKKAVEYLKDKETPRSRMKSTPTFHVERKKRRAEKPPYNHHSFSQNSSVFMGAQIKSTVHTMGHCTSKGFLGEHFNSYGFTEDMTIFQHILSVEFCYMEYKHSWILCVHFSHLVGG